MAKPRVALWAELIQLVPIISLAFPFIVQGRVDLSRASSGFLLGAILSLPISAVVVLRKRPLNPILIGTGLWLCLGALAFNMPIPALAAWLTATQAFGLFAAAFAVGLVATFVSPFGYIACPTSDVQWLRRASFALLALTALVVCWAWFFRSDLRLGGGLPFIVLNLARRLMSRRAPA
jgi:hypothetical protein